MTRPCALSEERHPRQLLSLLALVGVMLLAGLIAMPATARADETVKSCGQGPNEVFGHAAVFGINAPQARDGQPFGPNLKRETYGNTVPAGARATWQALAPAGLVINNATMPNFSSSGVNDGHQYGGGFYWQGGGYARTDQGGVASFGTAHNNTGFPSPYFGFQLVCGANPCGWFFHQRVRGRPRRRRDHRSDAAERQAVGAARVGAWRLAAAGRR